MAPVDVVGVTGSGGTAFRARLGQGADPRTLAHDHGWVTERPLDAVRGDGGTIDLRYAVRPVSTESRPGQPGRASDPGLDLSRHPAPVLRQRVAAYAVVTSARGLLATEFSARTSAEGRWGLPGGGVEDDEQPAAAVLREVAEETRQQITLGALVDVQTSHWVGRSPRGTVEDFHAVRLVYEGTCADPTPPVVVDVGGTTESARWVPVADWKTLRWTVGWRQVLAARLGG